MRTALLTALLLIIPHVMYGAPEDDLQVNGGTSAASDIVRQNEQQLELERQEALRQPTSNTPANPPPVIPCPAAQQSRDAQLDDLARLETHSTTCPEGGTIKDMPTQPPEGTSPSGDQPVDIQ